MVGQAPWPKRHGQGRHGQGRSTSHRDGVAGTVWCLQEVCRLVTWTHEAYAKMRLWPRVCGTGRRDDRARVPCPTVRVAGVLRGVRAARGCGCPCTHWV